MAGGESRRRLISEETWRSTTSQIPWERASSTQLPAEGPLNSLMAKNQSKGISTASFRVRLKPQAQRMGRDSKILRATAASAESSCTARAIRSKPRTFSGGRLRQLSWMKWPSWRQKLKKLKRSASSMTALASAWAGVAPLPICFWVPITAAASLPQRLK
jgi:hypothetical protein